MTSRTLWVPPVFFPLRLIDDDPVMTMIPLVFELSRSERVVKEGVSGVTFVFRGGPGDAECFKTSPFHPKVGVTYLKGGSRWVLGLIASDRWGIQRVKSDK